MNTDLTYLDTYVLQQDLRIRLPRSAIDNLGVVKGKTKFKIYLDKPDNTLILKPTSENDNPKEK